MPIEGRILMVLGALMRAATPDDRHRAVAFALRQIGDACGFDRVLLFQAQGTGWFCQTHAWVAPGISPLPPDQAAMDATDLPGWASRLTAAEPVPVDDCLALQGEGPERQMLIAADVKSALILPIMTEGQLTGWLRLDAVQAARGIPPGEVALLAGVAAALSAPLRLTEGTVPVTDDGQVKSTEQADQSGPRTGTDLCAGDPVPAHDPTTAGWMPPGPHRHKPDPAAADPALRIDLLESLFRMAHMAFVLTDFDTGRIVDVNEAFADLIRRSPGSLRTCTVDEVLPQDDAALKARIVTDLRQSGRYGPVKVNFRRQDGSVLHVVLSGFLFNDTSARRRVWNVIQDETPARQQAEALALQQREAQSVRMQLVAALESLDDGFVLFDAEDRLVRFNRRYADLFAGLGDALRVGVRYEDLVRAALDRGLHANAVGREQAFLQETLARHRESHSESEFVLSDGRIIRVSETATPDGGRVGLRVDVTARRRDEQRLANVIEGAQAGTWEWDVKTGNNRINARWMTMLGYPDPGTSAQINIDEWETLLHPQDRDAVRKALKQVFEGRDERFGYTLRMRHAQGHWVWVQSHGRVLQREPDGTPRLMAGVHLDVTALIAAEQRLQRIIDGATVGTWEYDRRTQTNLINSQWAEMLGYSLEALSPMTLNRWRDLLHPDDYLRMVETEVDAYAQGHWQFDFDIRLRHRAGHWVWVRSRGEVVQWDGQGQPLVLAGVHIDITEAKMLELSLSRERDTLARLMETSVSAIIAFDAEGRVVFANHEAEAVLGRRLAQIEGRMYLADDWGITDLAGAPISPQDLPFGQVMARRSTLRDFRHLIRWPDGQVRVLSINAAPLSAPGTDLAVVCAVTDVTDAVAAEDALRSAMARAEAASRAKSDFLANMSHEMRTPLHGVLGMAEVMSGSLTDPVHLSMLRVIQQSGAHLLDVINDILDLAKIESGRLALDLQPLRLQDLIGRIEAAHGIAAREKGLHLTMTVAPDLQGWRNGDSKRLLQILHNLVGNAVKFTALGGVTVRIAPGSTRDEAVIVVADSGIGMDPSRTEDVFEDFIQADGGITRSFGGTGLGLPITRRLARMMGGDIALHTAPGQGLEVTVRLHLPRCDPAGTGLARPDAATDSVGFSGLFPRLVGIRVLVAEDNATNQVILRAMLDRLGLHLVQVSDGEEAVKAWAPGHFDLLLFDISMPRKDGVSALHDIRARAHAAGVAMPPALAITANAMLHHVSGYLAAGFAACVAKPLRLEELARAMAESLDRG